MVRRFFDAALLVSAPVLAIMFVGIAFAAWNAGHLVSPVRITLFAGIPVALAVVLISLVTVWRPHRWLIAWNLAAIGVALVSVEVWLAYEELNANIVMAERHVTKPEPARAQICPRQLAAIGGVATPDGPLLPLGGIGENRVQVHLADGTYTDLTTDRFGFNNPDNVWSIESPEVLVIGDSFAFGADVPPGFGFVDLVRHAKPGTINLGCGGNGPLSEFAGLVEYGPVLRPRFVVWAYYEGNDLTKDILDELNSPLLRAYFDNGLDQARDLAAKQEIIDEALLALTERHAPASRQATATPTIRWLDVALFRNIRTRLGMTYGFRPHALDSLVQLVARGKEITESWGGTLLFLYLPGEVRYRTPLGRADANGYRDMVLEAVEKLGVTAVDGAAAFDAAETPENLYAGHYTKEGYALVADILLSALSKKDSE